MSPLENSNVTTVTQLPSKDITYDLDVLITSLGYQGEPLEGFEDLNIRFERNHIKNVKGRVLSKQDQLLPGLYTSGWISNGGQGVIANTMQSSFQVADEILADLPNLPSKNKESTDVMKHIHGTNEITTWQDWEKINKIEIEKGTPYGKPRMKFLTVSSVLKQL
ncbi:NADPH-adrenodoxin reductase [Maudiozyma exigua]|uniref:NADPH-adrenodoxin reductase n=1 Tax=Maudiozyma exigua TaxID=34358 RepID=A0A9P6WA67_MAUEX|nr:NADPH-adrenodoxin reductase [Kazachstania exigua]